MPTRPLALAIVRHFVSGEAFFTGIGCLVLAVAWRHFRWRGGERCVWFLSLIGALLILLSATPAQNGYAISVAVTLGWLLLGRPVESPSQTTAPTAPGKRKFAAEQWLSVAVVVLWLFEGASELSWQQMPVLKGEVTGPIVVIGDSVSAGVGEKEAVTWPNLLREKCQCEVLDKSRMGATVGSAIKNLPEPFPEKSLAIVELGGNDILGTTTVADFEANLDTLLQQVCPVAAETVMFELPLPPLGNRFGEVQRRLAKKHGVRLIPKRVLASVLLSPETTIDSIHLNQKGHDRLAEIVGKLISK
ncbi:SGNH/GDSL hydrolase family protein [Planctomicrobium piriforme]|uniref:Acyl-CoA thioesterase-1 n=1 Tax=Planctomicrobium piriforme TaxID=1576369 RepID=A0A1I3QCZ0_9PLAN|nr:GDSL-type esterase/lipase family protein [Planctomicrobium piriforme]SFJ31402.1 acyl-CoA thioesterase-1 [Planctomicrobium piriforme]